MSVAKKIEKYLHDKGITKSWLSKQINLSAPTLTAIFKEERKISIDEYIAIITALEVEPNTFLNVEEKTNIRV